MQNYIFLALTQILAIISFAKMFYEYIEKNCIYIFQRNVKPISCIDIKKLTVCLLGKKIGTFIPLGITTHTHTHTYLEYMGMNINGMQCIYVLCIASQACSSRVS